MVNRRGNDWIARGIEKAPAADRGAMHYGAALACLMKNHPRHVHFRKHLKAMRSASGKDMLLRKNFEIASERYPQLLKQFAHEKYPLADTKKAAPSRARPPVDP